MPRVVGALCWFHEPPELLEPLIRSLAGVVDELVSLDGPWQHFHHRALASPADQQEAISRTAEEVGLRVTMLGGDTLWASQVAKRAFLYETAAQRGDWLFVVDGDERVSFHDRDGLREALAATEFDVGSIHVKRVREGKREFERQARRLFRTTRGLTVIETHNGIVTDDGDWLAGPRRITKQPRLDCTPYLHILHRHMARGDQRNHWSQSYYQTRARQRIEVH